MPTNIATLDDRRKNSISDPVIAVLRKWILYSPNLPNKFSLDLNDEELDDYERILELSDTDLFAWSTGRQELPDALRSPLLDKLLSLKHMT